MAGCGDDDVPGGNPDAAVANPDGAPQHDTPPACIDLDLDGYGEFCAAGEDCDDTDPTVNPDAVETCNGADDDCSGVDDDGLSAPSCELTDGVCAGATKTCAGELGWAMCGAGDYGADYEVIEAACDGLDNDCDGSTDEGCDCVPPQIQGCGSDVGECVAGTQTCGDTGEWGPCAGEVAPMGESCDGLDNDCDDLTDEAGDLTAPDCPLQAGVCAGAKQSCSGGNWQLCGAAEYGASWQADETACDTFDNDCDGTVDEGCDCVDGTMQPCGSDVGACVAGTQTCILGAWGACAGETPPADESCNGTDDDCDGATDDGLTGAACPLTLGVCAASTQTCGGAGGWQACTAASYGPQYEATETTCDGLDNDCDGTLDEACPCVVGAMQPCGESTGACEPGTQTCGAAGWGACMGGVGPAPETCNGSDDDCNGATDTGLVPPPCALTAGVCADAVKTCGGASGWLACGAADYGSSYVAVEDGATNEAICDGLDNDCDGTPDENCLSGPLVAGTEDAILPSIYGNHVAYLAHDGTSWDVYVYDLRTGASTRLTTTAENEENVDVYGNIVAYQRGTGAAARIAVYDLVTSTETVITTTQSQNPRVVGSYVMWEDFRAGNWDIYLRSLVTGTETPYLTSTANETGADWKGQYLAYVTDASGAWRVHFVDVGTGTDTAQSTTASANQLMVAADWSYFGWTDARNAVPPLDANANWDVFAAGFAAPGTEDVVSTSAGAQILTGVDGRMFVWSDGRNGNWDVAISAYGGAEFVLTSSPALQGDPAISGNVIVWHDNRQGNFDLYASSFGGVPATGANWLKINEVLAEPPSGNDVNGDGTVSATGDEFIEIANATDVALDIGGCTITDLTGVRHTFAAGTTIPAVSTIIVFGAGAPSGHFGGATAVPASTGTLGLNNTGDTITLTCAGTVIDAMMYGPEGDNEDALVRSPELSGAFVRHSLQPAAAGRRFSPGTAINGYAF